MPQRWREERNMEDEEIKTPNGEGGNNSSVDIETAKKIIDDYKQNYVPKEEYEKKCQENAQLLQAYANGETGKQEQVPEPQIDLAELRNSLFNQENSNLEYARKALQLREELIKRGDQDPFLPKGTNVNITNEDVEKAEQVAEVFKHCIEYAEGDSEAFTNELQRLTKESMPMKFIRR